MILVKKDTGEIIDEVDSAEFREDNNSIEVTKGNDTYQYAGKDLFALHDVELPEGVVIREYCYIDGEFSLKPI